ncbi:hypothetical protein ALQ33_200113 [Pseudomonas syringae pv. philadelphi]|uniref:Uncharacterized protein n=1 Tax=Pseudomonas syringae pv. philadelphi TaxID=251706 RepID=A0A3M3Z8R3_9PSED|nr:hypothetical protein ALQ33_200113 [Pseudomonas syringae pv. philadelphi]
MSIPRLFLTQHHRAQPLFVQSLERTQPGLPLGIGHIRTQSLDYIRHGTVPLFTALNTFRVG